MSEVESNEQREDRHSEDHKQRGRLTLSVNVNAILTAVVLSVVCWVGVKVSGLYDDVAVIKAQMPMLVDRLTKDEKEIAALWRGRGYPGDQPAGDNN